MHNLRVGGSEKEFSKIMCVRRSLQRWLWVCKNCFVRKNLLKHHPKHRELNEAYLDMFINVRLSSSMREWFGAVLKREILNELYYGSTGEKREERLPREKKKKKS